MFLPPNEVMRISDNGLEPSKFGWPFLKNKFNIYY